MTDHLQHGLNRQESRCVEPGVWIVDGHTIRRHQSGWWSITYFDEHGIVQAAGDHGFPTLHAAREFLYERPEN